MIFISRKLKGDSPLRQWTDSVGERLEARSLLAFAAVPFTAPADADWWFFYSSRAVTFAGEVPDGTKLAAIGGGTAATLLTAGRRVDFCGDGHPERVAEDFLAVAEGRRVFFPRARQSRLSVQSALTDRLTVLDAVCYDNRPAPPREPIEARTYIFTSPLNVAAYLDHFALSPGARVLAIGPSTGGELERRGIPCTWPAESSEAGLVELLERPAP
ncbi:uroporphyrinogen-III synthase [Lewinella sp. IMCC34183]|uniref:uroporphyrinogen-III synthase n=1 Tax=Lewinella sp. IMCC34183 TaxID=2248762 RepID=UPI00130047CF|nr:uroporphyrinogen-III synthase [Lewinella sp. IMCC34183]